MRDHTSLYLHPFLTWLSSISQCWFRYLVNSPQGRLTLYYEPHCVYDKNIVEKLKADIVITPVIKQLLPNLTLVSGQEDAVQLAKLLGAKYANMISIA